MNNNKIIWIIGVMCSGKTYYSKIIGELFNKDVFHLDLINQRLPLIDAYKEAVELPVIEGYTPLRNTQHLQAITKALEGKEVVYILVEPSYEQWLENCKPIIACSTDENPPNYSKEEYETENKRLKELTNPSIIIK